MRIADDEFSVAGATAPVNTAVTSGPNQSRPGPAAAGDSSGNDILLGGAGNDIIYGGAGNDILHGGYKKSDIDTAAKALAGAKNVVVWDQADHFGSIADVGSNDGNDELHGGVGNDVLIAA